MAHSADACQPFGRAVAYAVYNLGVGIIVGLARTVVAVAYMAKHWFYNKQYQEVVIQQRAQDSSASHSRSNRRNRRVHTANREAKNATGFLSGVKAKVGQGLARVRRAVGDGVDELQDDARSLTREVASKSVESIQQARIDSWKGEALRGVLELLGVGAAFYTYMDNWHESRTISVLGLDELKVKIQKEREFDNIVQEFIPSYNPWF